MTDYYDGTPTRLQEIERLERENKRLRELLGKHVSCVSRASETCVYLRDGTKVVIQDSKGKGAKLAVVPQSIVKTCTPVTGVIHTKL